MSRQVPYEVHQFHVAGRMLAGKVVPFLGAGANLCGRPEGTPWGRGEYLPSGAELAAELIERVKYPDPNDRDLMRISQYVDATLGAKTLYEWVRDPFEAIYPPTSLHYFLARMSGLLRKRNKPRQVILTTNYDDALESAFDAMDPPEPFDLLWYEAKPPHCGRFIHQRRASDIPPADRGDESVAASTPIARPNEYADLEPDERTVIVKLHGAMVRDDPARDSYVITEDDYIRYLTGADIASQLPAVLRERITESHLLFLGYSMRDWNLRVVLERLGGDEVLGSQAWSVQREPSTLAGKQIEETLWGERDVDLRFILLDEYVEDLKKQVTEALAAEAEKAVAQERAKALARSKPPQLKPPPSPW